LGSCRKLCKNSVFHSRCTRRRRYAYLYLHYRRGKHCVRYRRGFYLVTCSSSNKCNQAPAVSVSCIHLIRTINVYFSIRRYRSCKRLRRQYRFGRCGKHSQCRKSKRKYVCRRRRRYLRYDLYVRRGRRCGRVRRYFWVGRCRRYSCRWRVLKRTRCAGSNLVATLLGCRRKSRTIILRINHPTCRRRCHGKNRRVIFQYKCRYYHFKVFGRKRQCILRLVKTFRLLGCTQKRRCKKSVRIIKKHKCRCSYGAFCYRQIIVRLRVRHGWRKCRYVQRRLNVPCRNACMNKSSNRRCKVLTKRRRNCRKTNIRRLCQRSCHVRCQCRGGFTWFGKQCRVNRGRGHRKRFRANYQKRHGLCTIKIRSSIFGRRCRIKNRCKSRQFSIPQPCINGHRSILTIVVNRRCRRSYRRRSYQCNWCCNTVKHSVSRCSRNSRRVTRTWWIRIGRYCRRQKSAQIVSCSRYCSGQSRNHGACRKGFRVRYHNWQLRIGGVCKTKSSASIIKC
jgi:hypothetical protein